MQLYSCAARPATSSSTTLIAGRLMCVGPRLRHGDPPLRTRQRRRRRHTDTKYGIFLSFNSSRGASWRARSRIPRVRLTGNPGRDRSSSGEGADSAGAGSSVGPTRHDDLALRSGDLRLRAPTGGPLRRSAVFFAPRPFSGATARSPMFAQGSPSLNGGSLSGGTPCSAIAIGGRRRGGRPSVAHRPDCATWDCTGRQSSVN
jgi:hypothetical protein